MNRRGIQRDEHEDGQMDVYAYSWVDSVWTETVTRVHEDEPDPVAMQTTRRSAIYNRIGNLVAERTELMTAAGVWEQIDGVVYEYSVNGKETKRTTFNGLITTSEWAGTCCGKSSETAPDGTRTTFTYDDNGRLIVRTVLDPNPIETHIGYDALGRQTVTWTTNRVAQLGTTPLRTTYDALGRVTARTDELGNTTSYSYSADERTRTVTQPTGATQTTVTDETRRMLAVSGTAVPPRTYTYGINADGTRWTKVFSGPDATAASWTKTTRDFLSRTLREEKPGFGNTLLATTYAYDAAGRVISETQADVTNPVNPVILSKTLSQYDRYGDLLFSALDVNQNGVIDFGGPDRVTGHSSAFIVKDDALWQEFSQTVYPDFDSDRAVVVAKSRQKLTNLGDFVSVSETEDIRGNVTTTTQSVNRNTGVAVSLTTVPTSIQPQVQIQNYGQLVESVSTSTITNHYAYDTLNRRVDFTDGRGNTSTTAYNTLGQVAYTEDAATNRTTYVYDQFGRQIETIDALNQSTHTVYDLRGNVIRQYGATYPVWYEYDAQGRMIAMATTRDTALDPAAVDSLDNPSLDVTRWIYDPTTGLLAQKLNEDGKGPSYTYTPEGKLATRTWARGSVTSYVYDVLGSLLSVNYSDATPDVSYAYNRLGRQLSAIAAGVSTNLYAYSTNTLEQVAETQNGVVINRSRDAFGREGGIAMESDYDVSYGYDSLDRFGAVVADFGGLPSTNTFTYSYLPGSSLVSGMTASTGHAWTRAYESNRHLITSVTNSFSGNLISAFDYANDEIGRRTGRLDVLPGIVAVTNSFGYNVCSEVTSAAMGTHEYGYVFDPIGNRITATNDAEVIDYAANGINQYTAISNTVPMQPEYDDDGNMTATGDGWHYVWNGENRLVLASNAMHLVTYSYDHQGRMVWKQISTNAITVSSRSLFWDGYNIIAETMVADSSTNTTYNIWGLDLDGTPQGAGGVGGLLAVINDEVVYCPAYDANGNVAEYTDANGAVVARYEYSPFGETVVRSGARADFFTHLFSTKPWCAVTCLSEYQYRKYSSVMGRWLHQDRVGESSSLNLFSYVNNKALNEVDVLGLFSIGHPETRLDFCYETDAAEAYVKLCCGNYRAFVILKAEATSSCEGKGRKVLVKTFVKNSAFSGSSPCEWEGELNVTVRVYLYDVSLVWVSPPPSGDTIKISIDVDLSTGETKECCTIL